MNLDISLEDFYLYMMDQPLKLWSPVVNEFYNYGKVISTIDHRWKNFQVERFIIMPGVTTARHHTHPNVDSIELAIAGTLEFEVNGILSQEILTDMPLGARHAARVGNNMVHAALAKNGGAFYSFQKWLNGVKPTSVGLDWKDEQGSRRDLDFDRSVQR